MGVGGGGTRGRKREGEERRRTWDREGTTKMRIGGGRGGRGGGKKSAIEEWSHNLEF